MHLTPLQIPDRPDGKSSIWQILGLYSQNVRLFWDYNPKIFMVEVTANRGQSPRRKASAISKPSLFRGELFRPQEKPRVFVYDKLELPNGIQMPCMGFGTWQVPNDSTLEAAVSSALQLGYLSRSGKNALRKRPRLPKRARPLPFSERRLDVRRSRT